MHLNRINLEVAVESLLDLPRISRIDIHSREGDVPEITTYHRLKYINHESYLLQAKFKW